MRKLLVHPAKRLNGAIEVPGDKSISHRAIMLGSLAYGTTRVRHFLPSADCRSTIGIFRNLGVKITQAGDKVTIHGRGLNSLKPSSKTLDAGNSGTTARIVLGLLAGQPFTSRLTGDKYLRVRPMKRVVAPLTQMGARITGPDEANHLPLKVETRKLQGIDYPLPIASAQVKSCLLMAGLYAHGKTKVTEPSATRDHTERMFSFFSIPYRKKGNSVSVTGPIEPFRGQTIHVPGDISSAAFFIVAGLLVPHSRILLKNVGINPTRTGILEALKKMGALISVSPKKTGKGAEPIADITVFSSHLKATEVGGGMVPRMIDEFPVFAVAATQAQGTTLVRNAEDLKVKESDRILMMAITLKKMGANIEPRPDGWVIKGPTPLKGCRMSSGGDHRVAMSLAVAGLVAQGPTTILDTENIDTSFPGFENCLSKLAKNA
ncbi:MAG TPA: 3-phosphoshikimate 1-carboxyvinyltransferase [bacterium]|nr:3-phosphoshikimate 1-carboxyvinyltransferase [bacterium]